MTLATATQLLDVLDQSGLLTPEQVQAARRELAPSHAEPKALAKALLERGWLTPYQINQVFQGKANELVLGAYLLLERLGEGGMGTVFKARNRNLGKDVALKVLREDLADN